MGEQPQIIKLDATDSTNSYLRALIGSTTLPDLSCVVTKDQLKGRGQMGTSWQSEPGKNLTFSMLKRFNAFPAEDQFQINIMVSLAIYDVLNTLEIPNLRVKWPNDIMSGSDKICGILIENMLKGQYIQSTIIGIGLNVNQTSFPGLAKVASLNVLTGKTYDLDALLNHFVNSFQQNVREHDTVDFGKWSARYAEVLFRKDKPSTFMDKRDTVFMGFIRGVSPQGKLMVELEDQVIQTFDLKEVRLLY